MSDSLVIETRQARRGKKAAPRVSVFAQSLETAEELAHQIANEDFDTHACAFANALGETLAALPEVAVIELNPEGEELEFARKLRSEPATYTLPFVFLYREEQAALRSLAQRAGADDYIHIATPPNEIRARLASLVWRAEVERRNAIAAGSQQMEIENFIFSLDEIREKIGRGFAGTLALVEAVWHKDELPPQTHNRTLTEAYGFLKLHLRRIDSVTFYGPTTLLLFLPDVDSNEAWRVLSRQREDFLQGQIECDIAIGLAATTHKDDLESTIEQAETALARARNSKSRIAASAMNGASLCAADARSSIHTVLKLEAGVFASPVQNPVALSALSEIINAHVATGAMAKREPSVNVDLKTKIDDTIIAPEAHTNESRALPKRLLIAVSDPVRLAQVNTLIRAAGFEVRAVFDGHQALDLLRIEKPDLLLLDYNLRGMNGVETLRRLRERSGAKNSPPVAIMFDAAEGSARIEAISLGARGIVTLPFDLNELLACMCDPVGVN